MDMFRIARVYRSSVLLLLAVALILGPAVTVYSSDTIEDLLETGSFSTRERRSLQNVFDAARSAGIPTGYLAPRLQEGIAKGIDAARITRALETDLMWLERARAVARSVEGGANVLADEARWARAATVLAAGRSPDELGQLLVIVAERPDRFRPAAALFVSLVEWGLASDDALRLVDAAVMSRLAPEQLPGITELFVLARRERIRPERMVERIIAGLERAESFGALRAMVVE